MDLSSKRQCLDDRHLQLDRSKSFDHLNVNPQRNIPVNEDLIQSCELKLRLVKERRRLEVGGKRVEKQETAYRIAWLID